MIVRPQTADDVAKLVKYIVKNGLEFTIRGGGHDMMGRSQAQDAVTIDMRDIRYVKISEGKRTATIGAGINMIQLQEELDKEKLATTVGNVGHVGYTGWAIYGGYGFFNNNFGLGVDNIVGAKVVDSGGSVLDTDEHPDLLKGIRGAGGAFGVIVELRIKTYHVESILAGWVFFECQDVGSVFDNMCRNFSQLLEEDFPNEIGVSLMTTTGPMGRMCGVSFVSSFEDEEKARPWLAKIEKLGTCVMNTVETTTPLKYLHAQSAFGFNSAYGTCRTANLLSLSKVAGKLGDIAESLPAFSGPALVIHMIRGPSTDVCNSSVFANRRPHFLVELIGTSDEESQAQDTVKWAHISRSTLQHADPDNSLPGTYVSLDMSGELTYENLFGTNLPTYKDLKVKYDPKNVFMQPFSLIKI
ncbi:putative 6-hydroxy-D-nicotine oxidase [Glarea lozoyensis 74030]|nr:putative 6-hydroxy-D-nicotine oxidase [Glarea lozoyensis 74030]